MILKPSIFLGEHAIRAAWNCMATGLFPAQPVTARPDYALLPRQASMVPVSWIPGRPPAMALQDLPPGLGRHEKNILLALTEAPFSLFRFTGPAGSGKTSTLRYLAGVLSACPFPRARLIVADSRSLCLDVNEMSEGPGMLDRVSGQLAELILRELYAQDFPSGAHPTIPLFPLSRETKDSLAAYPSLKKALRPVLGGEKGCRVSDAGGISGPVAMEAWKSGRERLKGALGCFLAETLSAAGSTGRAILVLDGLEVLPSFLAKGLIQDLSKAICTQGETRLRLALSSRPDVHPQMPKSPPCLDLAHYAPDPQMEMIFRVDRFLENPFNIFYFSNLDQGTQNLFLQSLSCLRASLVKPKSLFNSMLHSVGGSNLAACHLLGIRFCLSLCFSREHPPRITLPQRPGDLLDRNELFQDLESLLGPWEWLLGGPEVSSEQVEYAGEWLSGAFCRCLEREEMEDESAPGRDQSPETSWVLRPGARHFLQSLARKHGAGKSSHEVESWARTLAQSLRPGRGFINPDRVGILVRGFETDFRARLIHLWLAAGIEEERELVEVLGSFAMAVGREIAGACERKGAPESQNPDTQVPEPPAWNDFSEAALAASGLGRSGVETFNAFYWGGSNLSLAGFHSLCLIQDAGHQGMGWKELRASLQAMGYSRVLAGCILLDLMNQDHSLVSRIPDIQEPG
ncbi:MAG: hypothetical protein ABIJ95_11460, partial [Pseudomonadota bacterium]